MRALTLSIILALFVLTGCGDTTASRSLSGSALGAAAGGLIGSMSGNFGSGAAIGAGVGLVGGFLDDQYKKGNIDF
ncbi:glycine zipper family protein [Desulfopila sp. IMCC35008]|uniref:glycine zipper family protein n=1 Tax=Desulfopila sp. IMCC35008 TaxID=2653858 RepID=UPI0013D1219E|nr:glycine zipper family protein [Desulfopila sp. IMCC35008]